MNYIKPYCFTFSTPLGPPISQQTPPTDLGHIVTNYTYSQIVLLHTDLANFMKVGLTVKYPETEHVIHTYNTYIQYMHTIHIM